MSQGTGSERMDDAKAYPLHVLSFYWDGFDPHMGCYDTVDREEVELDLKDVGFAVSERKTCIGLWDRSGEYVPCPKSAPVTKFSQCPECSKEVFLPDQDCVFEPKCDGVEPAPCGGDARVRRFCGGEHIVYLAFYDTRMKIGMSTSRRVRERLIEQGADAYSVLGRYQGRRRAREEERDVSKRLGIPEWYRQQDLLDRLSRPLDKKGIEDRLEGLRMTIGVSKGVSPERLEWLTDYPIGQPLTAAPKLQQASGEHSGSYIGVKGKWLIYDSGGLKALNLSDLPGRFVARRVA